MKRLFGLALLSAVAGTAIAVSACGGPEKEPLTPDQVDRSNMMDDAGPTPSVPAVPSSAPTVPTVPTK